MKKPANAGYECSSHTYKMTCSFLRVTQTRVVCVTVAIRHNYFLCLVGSARVYV